MSKVSDAQLQDILEHIGNNRFIPQVVRQFDKSMLFSTDEKVVGQWVDGRLIYQKTYNTGVINSTFKEVDTGLTNVEYKEIFGYAISPSDSRTFPLPMVHQSNMNGNIMLRIDGNKIAVQTQLSGITDSYVTIRYTKTTDTALPYELGDENDYSTTEKLVGKWIDGSDLFQKTIVFGYLPNNNVKAVAHNINNLGFVVDARGTAYNGSGGYRSIPILYNTTYASYNTAFLVTTTDIQLETNNDMSAFYAYVTIQYTKTTD